jgi:hypothetical protein
MSERALHDVVLPEIVGRADSTIVGLRERAGKAFADAAGLKSRPRQPLAGGVKVNGGEYGSLRGFNPSPTLCARLSREPVARC